MPRMSLQAEIEAEQAALREWRERPHVSNRPRHPRWLVRRWVMMFGPDLKQICYRLRRRGVKIVGAFRPSMCVWNTLMLRGDRKVIDEVLKETGQEFHAKCPLGGFE